MPLLFKDITSSLARKLIITVSLLILIGGGVSWYVLIETGKRNLINSAIAYTASYSLLVKKSTRYGMLTFHRESIQQTIMNMGSAADIKEIRIFNGKGRIYYASQLNEIGTTVDRSVFACTGCHRDPEKPAETLTGNRQWVIYEGPEGYRILTFVEPIYNEPSCATASCHAHSQSQRVLGILETDFSLDSVDKAIRRQTRDMSLYAFAFTGISAFILYLVLRRFVLNPVSALSGAMKKAADGDLSNRVSVTSQDEMGLLAGTYNTMAEELKVAREKMTLWTQSLEEEVAKKTYELRKSQDKLIQAEKLASLGRLTADVAHEIRNPLSAVGGFARRLHKIVTGDKEKEYASVVVSEVNRLERILRDILTFSRDARLHLEPQTIADVVHSAMHLYKNLCEDQSVHAVVTLPEDLPPVLIDKDQVVQALSNLVTNALEAMPYGGGGTLTVTAEMEEVYDVTFVVVRVADSGQGIREDHLPLIFEPFFSTKDIGRGSGTGLGLSITRKIMEEHGGFIRAESEPGKGSTFSLYFPYQAEDQAARTPCWEFMKCGRDRDASTKCPANPHFGRICWVVAGTFCEGKVQGTFAQKCEDCRKCEFYQKVQRKEL